MDELELSTDTIDLRLDEENELTFEVSIQGESEVKPIYRFVCETANMSYSFPGEPISENQVIVQVPSLMNKLAEGQHRSHLEVIVDNRLFIPMHLTANFKYSTRVVAEGVKVKNSSKENSPPVVKASIKSNKKTVKEKKRAQGKTLSELYDLYKKK